MGSRRSARPQGEQRSAQGSVLSTRVSCHRRSPGGMPGAPAPRGAVNGLLLRVIKMELKINSLLQRAAVVARLRAAAVVPGLSPASSGMGVGVAGAHRLAGSSTQGPHAVAATSLGTPLPWHRSPSPPAPGTASSRGKAARTRHRARPSPCPCVPDLPSPGTAGKASPEIF